jgi:hypothetical protein
MEELKTGYETVAFYLVIDGVQLSAFNLGRTVQLYDKRQAHYYWFIVAFICVAYARDGAYTYKSVETTGEDNATKVYTLELEKMVPLEAAHGVDANEFAASYRNYFFTYRAPQFAPAAEVVAVDEAAEDTWAYTQSIFKLLHEAQSGLLRFSSGPENTRERPASWLD